MTPVIGDSATAGNVAGLARMKSLGVLCGALMLAGCGVIYHPASVTEGVTRSDAKVRVERLTAETVLVANRQPYAARSLPDAFRQTATVSAAGAAATPPAPVFDAPVRPGPIETRLPPQTALQPYRIGVGDVLLLATPQTGNTVEELSSLLAAQTRRQGYTVQDDGAVSIPDIGRVAVDGRTLEEAEAAIFDALVQNNISPAFSLEVSEFNARRVAIGGEVQKPGVVPVTLAPLTLDEALAGAGGVAVRDVDPAVIRIYRDGTLYQVPLRDYLGSPRMRDIRLQDGDSVFVDSGFELDQAEAYFRQQIELMTFRQQARQQALAQLQAEFALRQSALDERRNLFKDRLELGAEERDYVYVTGEVRTQGRIPLPFEGTASLADALYAENGGFPAMTGNPQQIYVLRGSPDPMEFSGITAWHLDASQAAHIVLATRFELRPDDVVFVAEQPITKWNRVVSQILPSVTFPTNLLTR